MGGKKPPVSKQENVLRDAFLIRDLGPAFPGAGKRWRIVLVGPLYEDGIADELAKNLRSFFEARADLMERLKRATQRKLAKRED